jgi:hypothetical protein
VPRARLARTCAALGLIVAGLGCSTPPPKPAESPSPSGPSDNWKRSATWLYATRDAKGGPGAECDYVRKLLADETHCRGPLCRYAVELGDEWRGKCDKLKPDAIDELSTLQAELRENMKREPTPCSRDFDRLLKDGCQPADCAEKAQAWVTRCAEGEAGPLCIAMLQRAVERALGPDDAPHLDTRSCSAMAKGVREAGKCADESSCRDSLAEAEAYRARCTTDDSKPDVLTALSVIAVTLGAARDPKPVAIADEPKLVSAGEVPLALADGSGAIVELCHRPVVARAEYFAARDKCQGTRLGVARITQADDGTRLLTLGHLMVPEQLELTGPYPWLTVAGEGEELGKQRLEAVKTDLAAVTQAPDSAAAVGLVAFVDKHADAIERSETLRELVHGADAKLVPVLRRLGEAKAAAMRGSRDTLAQRGLLERARARALADVAPDGKVQLGANTRAFWLETAKLWPEATAAHWAALGTLERTLQHSPKPAATTVEQQLGHAKGQAAACGAAAHERLDSEKALLACAFDGCEEARRTELVQRWQRARAAAEAARQELDLSLGPLGQSALSAPMAVEAGCGPARR